MVPPTVQLLHVASSQNVMLKSAWKYLESNLVMEEFSCWKILKQTNVLLIPLSLGNKCSAVMIINQPINVGLKNTQ